MKLKRATAKKRLLKLADFMANMPDNNLINMNVILDEDKCGTAGCAMGYATMIPEFKACGLSQVWSNARGGNTNTFDSVSYRKVGARFFGLDEETANYLFNPKRYADVTDRDTVVTRIRRVAARMRS